MEEIWKKIPNFEDYEISTLGRVRNVSGKLLSIRWNGKIGNRYLAAQLQRPKSFGGGWKQRRKIMKIHRLLLMTFVRMPKKGECALHKNDIPDDNRLENLYWGTRQQNASDSIRNGTFKTNHPGYGENNVVSKHSDELVVNIRKEYTGKRGEQTKIAKKYGVSQSYVSALLLGKLRNIQGTA